MEEEVYLLPSVDQFLRRICNEKNQAWPDAEARRELASLSEELAHKKVLQIIYDSREIKTLGGFIKYLVRKCSSPSPAKTIRTSYFQSPSAISSSTPQQLVHFSSAGPTQQSGNNNGQSLSVSSVARSLDQRFQGEGLTDWTIVPEQPGNNSGQSPYPRASSPSIAPAQLGEAVNRSPVVDKPADHGRAHLAALGELEFRKQFLILSYAGKTKLKNVIAAEDIRDWKNLSMVAFEMKVWEALGSQCISKKDRQLSFDWDYGNTHVYYCHVFEDGSYTFKGPYLNKISRTLLQKEFGDDNVLMVKFVEEGSEGTQTGSSIAYNNYATYSNVAREGILVGLRRYHFFAFKDGGKGDKIRSPMSSPVKCYFVRVGSDAAIDRDGGYKLANRSIYEGRSLFMHAHTISSMDKYMARFSLILSKTTSVKVDWSLVKVEKIDDVDCLDESGNHIYDRDGKRLMHTDGTGFISEDLALLCPKIEVKGKFTSKEHIKGLLDPDELDDNDIEMTNPGFRTQEPPLLIQCRLFHEGNAYKGTFLVNKLLPPKTLHFRRSMLKVEKDPNISDKETINSLEIVCTSAPPRKTYLSRILIALLLHGGVPKEYFMELLRTALEDAHGVFCKPRAALKVAEKYGEIDDDFLGATMIRLGIPLEESYLRNRLSSLLKLEENNKLSKGKLYIPDSYVLMGTADPTGILERDEVCVILGHGQLSGKVLVYRYPGLHFGDIHVLKAIYVKELESIVGNAKYAIFFSCKGPRNIVDEMAGGDFDGDPYWVSRNPQLLEWYKPSEPWIATSVSTQKVASRRPADLSPEALEDMLFGNFLTNRFQPSYAMSEAADNWLAWMDRFLTLGDSSMAEKKDVMEKMLELVNIYYTALDAPKKGEKVEVPKELKVPTFPHYMDNKKYTYTSTSILGVIYDTVIACQAQDRFLKEVKKLPVFDVNEVPQHCLDTWKERHKNYRSKMASVLRDDDKQGRNQAANNIIKEYKEMLYMADDFEESKRPKDEIFNEALAIYHVCYDYASSVRKVGLCSFAWKVAGKALCQLHANKKNETFLKIAPSVLKDLCN